MSNYSLTKESDVGKSLADAKLNDYDNDIDEEMKCVIMPGVGKSFKKATIYATKYSHELGAGAIPPSNICVSKSRQFDRKRAGKKKSEQGCSARA